MYEPNSFVPLATVQGASDEQRTYWYQCDQVGVPQELTDQEGNIVWAADYKAWGQASIRQLATGTDGPAPANSGPVRMWHGWEGSGDHVAYMKGKGIEEQGSNKPPAPPPIEQPFRLQGQHYDEETGLHYNRFRYYDPEIGRFMSQDPIGLLGGLNLFRFSRNAISWTDVLGLCTCPIHHICTNKNEISEARGGPWTPRFEAIFKKAGYDLDDDINKIGIAGHAGPHPEEYHTEVLQRLQDAVKGKSGEAYKKAFEDEMESLRKDVTNPDHKLNKLLCKK
jgi:RHS repeat-associated protein